MSLTATGLLQDLYEKVGCGSRSENENKQFIHLLQAQVPLFLGQKSREAAERQLKKEQEEKMLLEEKKERRANEAQREAWTKDCIDAISRHFVSTIENLLQEKEHTSDRALLERLLNRAMECKIGDRHDLRERAQLIVRRPQTELEHF